MSFEVAEDSAVQLGRIKAEGRESASCHKKSETHIQVKLSAQLGAEFTSLKQQISEKLQF